MEKIKAMGTTVGTMVKGNKENLVMAGVAGAIGAGFYPCFNGIGVLTRCNI